jgi:hypothetical protein
MLTAPHSLKLFWKRVVAALSLLAAAALGPTAPAPVNGAGVGGSRAGSGPAVANAATALMASMAAALVEGGELKLRTDASGDLQAKAYVPPSRVEMPVLRPQAASPALQVGDPPQTHASRSGLTRAPPAA